jgi:IclR family pca regulon transcriptional regulator
MAGESFGRDLDCSPIEFMGEFRHARNMPKPKRENGEEHATDFVESLDRGLPLLQKFGDASGPMMLSDLARAADLPRATARRILFVLDRGGFVATDGKLFTLMPASPRSTWARMSIASRPEK